MVGALSHLDIPSIVTLPLILKIAELMDSNCLSVFYLKLGLGLLLSFVVFFHHCNWKITTASL